VVPALWHIEMSNSLAVAERRSIPSAADIGYLRQEQSVYITGSPVTIRGRGYVPNIGDPIGLDFNRRPGIVLSPGAYRAAAGLPTLLANLQPSPSSHAAACKATINVKRFG
jgi:hypothetical protein